MKYASSDIVLLNIQWIIDLAVLVVETREAKVRF